MAFNITASLSAYPIAPHYVRALTKRVNAYVHTANHNHIITGECFNRDSSDRRFMESLAAQLTLITSDLWAITADVNYLLATDGLGRIPDKRTHNHQQRFLTRVKDGLTLWIGNLSGVYDPISFKVAYDAFVYSSTDDGKTQLVAKISKDFGLAIKTNSVNIVKMADRIVKEIVAFADIPQKEIEAEIAQKLAADNLLISAIAQFDKNYRDQAWAKQNGNIRLDHTDTTNNRTAYIDAAYHGKSVDLKLVGLNLEEVEAIAQALKKVAKVRNH